jgi:hypothetical protein
VTKSTLCAFCDRKLDGSDEHILLSTLGGRKSSRFVLCSVHNHEFGETIDKAVTREFRFFCNLLAIKTGRRRETATLRDIQTTRGDRINLLPGGRMTVDKPRVLEDTESGPKKRRIRLVASTTEQLRRMLPVYLAQYGDKVTLDEPRVEMSIEPGAQVEFTMDFDDGDVYRCVARMAVTMLASVVGTDAVRGADMADVRNFVLDGSAGSERVCREYTTEFLRAPEHDALPAYAHRIGVIADPDSRVAYGQLELFGLVNYTVLLSDAWAGPPAGRHYGVDPVTGEGSSVEVPACALATAEQLATRRATKAEFDTRMRAVRPAMSERKLDVEIDNLVEDTLEQFLGHLSEDTEMTEELAMRIAAQITERFLAARTNTPFRESLDSASVVAKPASPDDTDES